VNHPSGRPRWRTRPTLLGVLLVLALLATVALAPTQAGTRMDNATEALTGWLWPTRWVWPLAAALTLAALSMPPARRRWPRPTSRIPPAIGMFAGLVGLASLTTVRRPAASLLVVVVVLGVGLLAAWAFEVPRRIVPRVPDAVLDRLQSDRDRLEVTEANAKLRNDVRTTALQALGGLAVLAGAVLAFQQLTEDRRQAVATQKQALAAQELTRQGQASERFTRAIDQLGSKDRGEVQIGGIYGLEQIAQQAPDNRLAVTEVLVAYLHRRVRLAKPPPDVSSFEALHIRAPDVHAVLTVLGRRQIAPNDPELDLRELDLRGAGLRGANLSRALLSGTFLHGADLHGAHLHDADLRSAHLNGANLGSAHLNGASLNGADLRGAHFDDANLRGVGLFDANLSRADLHGANLSATDLRRADLRRADLSRADLSGASLNGASLNGADLRGANLSGADFNFADLSGALR
jgi:Pentapeptide repeats (8 copies)